MDRREALQILGLQKDASVEDVKTAYRELAQILHPDRYSDNKRLQERASEQFKLITKARDFLLEHPSGVSSVKDRSKVHNSNTSYSNEQWNENISASARLHAVKTMIVTVNTYLDKEYDTRRNYSYMLVAGLIGGAIVGRIPFLAAVAVTFIVWGLVGIIRSHSQLTSLEEQLEQLKMEEQKLESSL